MSKEQILVTPQQDLCAVVANASKNAEIVLAPGKYILNRPLIVDKTIVMKGQTGKADDVMVGRNNATVLIVTDGKPTFQGILFYAPATSDDAPFNTNEFDPIDYDSAVAVRESGNATFIGCKCSSKQRCAFSARGKKAKLTLEKCWIPNSGQCGVMADGQAEAIVKDTFIQNVGMACVDSDEKGTKVTVENSRIENAVLFGLCAHNRGFLVARKCSINAGESLGAYIEEKGELELEGCSFVSELHDDMPVDLQTHYGVVIHDGFAKLTDCRMSKLIVGVFMASPGALLEMKRVEMAPGMMTSVIYDETSPKFKVTNCKLGEPPLERGDYISCLKEVSQQSSIAKWNPSNFSDAQKSRADVLKTQYYEKILGKEFPHVYQPDESFYEGGQLELHYYLKSRFGGTFILSKELVSPEFSHPSFEGVDAYELAIATREPFYLDDNGDPLPDDELVVPYSRLFLLLSKTARYVWEEASVARYQTLTIPLFILDHHFIFDLVDEPTFFDVDDDSHDALDAYALQSPSSKKDREKLSLDDALQMYSDSEDEPKEEKPRSTTKRSFGVLVMIEIFESELNYIREHEGAAEIFLQKLKEQNRWPFSDMDRPPIF